ncbi:MAG: ABC transporter permease [Armatimonadetes bacterium]|nr:ABC transporter permease [Armatimonadota bacterium]
MNKISVFFLKKYFSSPKKEWLRFDSIFMILGIIISVATLTVALSIFEGYEKVLKKTILGVNSHIYIFKNGEDNLNNNDISEISSFLESQPEVVSSAKIIITQAMAINKNMSKTRVKGCLIRGIDWNLKNPPTTYKECISDGNYELIENRDIVLGYRLAKELNLLVGDSLTLISPMNSKITPMGLKPKQQNFHIVGLYRSGMYEYDSKYVFLNLDEAAEFCSIPEEYSMMEIKLKDDEIERADYLAYKWTGEFGYKYQIHSWIDFNGNLFSLLKLEKWVLFIILSFLVLIASFNVVSTVTTSIIERRRELGILKAFGASNQILKKIFVGKSLLISFFSITLGQVSGLLIAVFLSKQNFFAIKGDVYFLNKINVDFNLFSWMVVLVVSLLIVFSASSIPLRKISKLEITEIIR